MGDVHARIWADAIVSRGPDPGRTLVAKGLARRGAASEANAIASVMLAFQ